MYLCCDSAQVIADLASCATRTTGAIILHIDYGYEVKEGHDPFVKAAHDAMSVIKHLIVPKPYLVDTFPRRECQYTIRSLASLLMGLVSFQ